MVCRSGLFITQGTVVDCKQIEGFSAQHLLVKPGNDTNDIFCQAANQGMSPAIPPQKSNASMAKSFIKRVTWLKTPFPFDAMARNRNQRSEEYRSISGRDPFRGILFRAPISWLPYLGMPQKENAQKKVS